MKLLTWNIQSGGGTRVSGICDYIIDTNADLVALTEFQIKNEQILREKLNKYYSYISTSSPIEKQNGLFIASKYPFSVLKSKPDLDSERWMELDFERLALNILVIHIPGAPDNKFQDGYGISGEKRKQLFWDSVLAYTKRNSATKSIILGDFNTGLRADAEGAMFKHSHYMTSLIDSGFIDTWRSLNKDVKDYTYYSKRKDKSSNLSYDHNGFRLDYIFVSPKLRNNIVDSNIIHAPRKKQLSDHASVIADIDV